MPKRFFSLPFPGSEFRAAAAAVAAVAAFAVMAVAPAARGYVLEGAHVLDLMIDRLGSIRGLAVDQQVVLYDDRLPEGHSTLEETARYRPPDAFRSDTTSPGVQRTFLQVHRSTLAILDGRLSLSPETPFDRYKDLLLYRNRKMLEKQLARRGVDVTVSSLGRFEDHIAFVVGAHYPDETRSQVWIDKETFRPLRWVLRSPDDPPEEGLEIQYRKWAKSGPVQYPMQVLFFRDGRLVREINARRLAVNPAFPDNLFDPDDLQAVARPAPGGDGIGTGRHQESDDNEGRREHGGGRIEPVPCAPTTND